MATRAVYFSMWIFAALALNGCALTDGGNDPEKVLSRALSGISAKDNFSFNGSFEVKNSGIWLEKGRRFEGFVVHRNQLYIKTFSLSDLNVKQNEHEYYNSRKGTAYLRSGSGWKLLGNGSTPRNDPMSDWNPVYYFRLIQKYKKTVEIDGKLSDPEKIVLNIRLDPKEIANVMNQRLRDGFNAEVTEVRHKTLQRDSQATAKDLKMQRDIHSVYTAAEKEWQEISNSLSVNPQVLLWIERKTNLPKRLQVNMVMNYSLHGKDFQEINKVTCDITNFDKFYNIP
ncbi:hypothetical protein [Ferviditalea candida]|uniref:Lipoprotein n=1 Tax=Ferviditalea candida TaxID=3108399 RepID=A0ABU5ZMY0_9BACL|nr:hypothetical protein [Paenibacillaceae bacterium T2]